MKRWEEARLRRLDFVLGKGKAGDRTGEMRQEASIPEGGLG